MYGSGLEQLLKGLHRLQRLAIETNVKYGFRVENSGLSSCSKEHERKMRATHPKYLGPPNSRRTDKHILLETILGVVCFILSGA